MIKYYTPFFYLCLLDWFFGSWISAELQQQPPYNQGASWAYQSFYGFVVIAGLLISDRLNQGAYTQEILRTWPRFIACGLLFLGYVEDLLFYLLLHVWNPHGYDFYSRFMPEYFSGWLGWLTGMISGGDFVLRLPMAGVIVTAIIALIFSIVFVRKIS